MYHQMLSPCPQAPGALGLAEAEVPSSVLPQVLLHEDELDCRRVLGSAASGHLPLRQRRGQGRPWRGSRQRPGWAARGRARGLEGAREACAPLRRLLAARGRGSGGGGQRRGRPRAWRRARAGGGPRGPGSMAQTTTRTAHPAATERTEASTATGRGLRARGPRVTLTSACCWAAPWAPWGCCGPRPGWARGPHLPPARACPAGHHRGCPALSAPCLHCPRPLSPEELRGQLPTVQQPLLL